MRSLWRCRLLSQLIQVLCMNERIDTTRMRECCGTKRKLKTQHGVQKAAVPNETSNHSSALSYRLGRCYLRHAVGGGVLSAGSVAAVPTVDISEVASGVSIPKRPYNY